MFKYSKLSPYKIKKILYCFSQDLTAMQTANLLGINRNTINRYYNPFSSFAISSVLRNTKFSLLIKLLQECFYRCHLRLQLFFFLRGFGMEET